MLYILSHLSPSKPLKAHTLTQWASSRDMHHTSPPISKIPFEIRMPSAKGIVLNFSSFKVIDTKCPAGDSSEGPPWRKSGCPSPTCGDECSEAHQPLSMTPA
ncbi:P-loop containing nucleoside triphosphatehydrolases superfamily protein [Striga asiatica]|uniref:P-loop containing nucleoside triphosphatehydrolases superfamily protein n=1 Tax=Striga asiatica TaxID=4170 RepID=A0A5A7P4M9_STRAF|nr:P-loop containing nucleoside triphosphatehydrolases superfamily protein [Striga asiatica]